MTTCGVYAWSVEVWTTVGTTVYDSTVSGTMPESFFLKNAVLDSCLFRSVIWDGIGGRIGKESAWMEGREGVEFSA